MRYISLVALMVLGSLVPGSSIYECGNLQFSSNNVNEHDSVDLIYSYSSRYNPRKWYKIQGKQWTKLYDSSLRQRYNQQYSERFQDDKYILTLPSVTIDDSGLYVVLCATDVHKQSATAELKVIPQSLGQGLCGRLEILSSGSAVGSLVQFKFTANYPQPRINWQLEDRGTFITLGLDARVYLTNNDAHTIFARKLYVQSKDMGTYRVQCHDGSVSNIVDLAVDIIPPGKPVITNTKSYHGCKNCLLAVADKSLNIQCSSYNGSAPVDLKLYFNDIKINSAVSQDVTRSRVSVEKLQLIQKTDENGIIKCTAENAAVDRPVETTAGLYFFTEPANPVIQTRDCIEGKIAAITCISTGGKPAPTIRFFYDQNIIEPKGKITINEEDGTARVESVFHANLTRKDNLQTIKCKSASDSQLSTKWTEKMLDVKFPPNKIEITKVAQISSPQGDTNLTLRCTIGESNPRSTTIWQGLDTIKRAPAGDKNNAEVGPNGGFNFQHDFLFTLSKDDNTKEIKCLALNGDFPELDIQESFRINIPYQPIIRIVGGSGITTHEGSDVTIRCGVDSNPVSKISWSKDGILLKHADKAENRELSLTLYNVSLYNDSTMFTCSAQNGVGVLVTRNVTLFVKEKKLAIRRVPPSGGEEGIIVGVLCGTIFIIVLAVIVVIVFTRRRRLLKSDRQSSVRIQIENRQPSIHPPADEPVYNNLTLQPEVTNGNDNAEYAKVIPRSQRNATSVNYNNQDNAEYAVVIPKSQRQPKRQAEVNENKEHTSSTGNLVYAELELHTPGVEEAVNNRSLPRQPQPATEYVSIDFTKSKEFNDKQNGQVDTDV